MSAERWKKVKELFGGALEREPADRARFLADACHGETDGGEIRKEVERLLEAHARAGSFIETPPVLGAGRSGQTIGRYQVGRLLGVGGMGEVYLARDPELGRDVAIKLATGSDAEAHARLRREAQHASQLNHPHICTIYEVGTHEGQPFISMEYVEGQRLSDVMQPGGLPLHRAVRCGIQICYALAHAHGSGVVHRDLKTANIVMAPDGRAKVLDFGVAGRLPAHRLKDLSDSHDTNAEGFVAGTLACMAPEVLRGAAADERGDIWALGVLLYEMVSGVRPFSGATGFELTGAILHGSPPPLPDHVPPSLRAAIVRCLEKDPARRYRTADEVRAALELVDNEISGRAPARPARKNRALAGGLAAAVVVLLAIGLWWWRSPAQPDAQTANPPAGVGPSGHPAIAVMSFDLPGPSDPEIAWLSRGVPSMLLTGLAQTRGLDLVSMRRLEDAAKQIGAGDLNALDRSGAADVARRAGAGAVVLGSIFRSGAEIRIDAQMEDLASGRVLVAESVRGADLFGLVDQLASRMRDGVGLRAEGVRGVAAVSSPSLDAYRLFAQGTEAYQHVRIEDARRLLEGAVTIDPQFATAYLYLGFVNYWAGRQSDRQRYFATASEHMDRLSERNRLLLRVELARDVGNGGEAVRMLDQLLAEFPDWHDGYASALEVYAPITGLVYDPDKRLAILRRALDAQPASGMLRNVHGYALLETGQFARARDEFEAYARMAPNEPNPYDSLGETYLAMGMPERGIEYFSRTLTLDPTFYQSRTARAVALGMLGRFDEAIAEETPDFTMKAFTLMRVGRFREASQAIATGIKRPIDNASSVGQASAHLMASLLALEQRQYARTLADIDEVRKALAPLPPERQRVYLVVTEMMAGLAHVRAGRIEQARQHLEAQRRLYNAAQPFEKGWYAALDGEIALAQKRLPEAAAAFLAGEPVARVWISLYLEYPWALMSDVPGRDGAARVAKARGDTGEAIRIYRSLLVTGPDQKWPAMFDPRYVLEIARLLEASGDTKGALVEYSRFLGLWKNADRALPELTEARRAVARLE